MTPKQGIDPTNPHRARVFLSRQAAEESLPHPQDIMRELAATHGFTILGGVPQSLFDGWDLWIEFPGEPPELPDFFRDCRWKRVGEA